MKKAVSMLVVFALMVSMATCVFADNDTTTFSDVPFDHWAYNEIQYFYNENIVDGIGNDKFAPDDNVTREQLAKLISIIYGKTDYQATAQTFGDVTPDMWSYNYIESVKEYLTGYYPADGQAFYNPNAYATREDVAYALVKISELDKEFVPSETVLKYFSDSNEISPNLRGYVSVAVQSGLMVGYDGELNPQDGITRAETVTILFRAIKKPVTDNEIIDEKPEVEEEVKEEVKEETKNSNAVYYEITNIKQISGYKNVKGKITVEIIPKEDSALFNADLKCIDGFDSVNCKIVLRSLEYCDNDEITGLFRITYDDVVRYSGIKGTVTIKDGILKFDAEGENYNLIAYLEDEEETNEDDEKENAVSSGNYTNVIETDDIVRFTKVKDIDTTGNIVFKWSSDEKIAEFTADLVIKETALSAEKVRFELDKLSYCSVDEVRGSFTLYREGKVYEENIRGTITAEDGVLTFTTTDDEYVLVANYEDDIKTVSSLWDNEAYVYYDINEFNGKDADGNCQLHYVRDEEFAEITYFKIESGEDVYVYEITDIISVEEDVIEVIYTLTCNDEVIAEDAEGKFVDYILKLGKYATFVSEDGKHDVEMQIIEISG